MAAVRLEAPEPSDGCLPRSSLEALRAGRLEGTVRDRVEAHLAVCEACVDHLIALEGAEPTLAPGTLRRVMAATEPERVPARALVPRWAAGGLAAAAALMLVFLMPGLWPRSGGHDIPPYSLTLAGQVMEVRGEAEIDAGGPGVYHPESDIVLRAAPRQGRPSRLPDAVVYLEQADGIFSRIEPPPAIERDPDTGLIEMRLRAGEVLGERYGSHRIRLVLLPEGTDAPARLSTDEDAAPGAEVLETSIIYRR